MAPWPVARPPSASLSRTTSILTALNFALIILCLIAHRVGLVFKKCAFTAVLEAEQSRESPLLPPAPPPAGSTSRSQLRPASQTLKVSPSGGCASLSCLRERPALLTHTNNGSGGARVDRLPRVPGIRGVRGEPHAGRTFPLRSERRRPAPGGRERPDAPTGAGQSRPLL